MPPRQKALTPQSLRRALAQGELERVYYVHGPEELLREEAVRAVIDRALDPATRDFNFDQRAVGQLDPEGLHTLVNTLPMLAERRVVVLRDVEAARKKPRLRTALLAYLEHPAAETVLVMVQGAGEDQPDEELLARSCGVGCEPLGTEQVGEWLTARAREAGVTLAPDAARHLVQAVGGDLRALWLELEKLASLGRDAAITVEEVGALVGVRHGETLWDWRDAVLDDRTARALGLIDLILEQPGATGVRMVTAVGSTLIGVGMTRGLLDRDLRGRTLEQAVLDALFKRVKPYAWLGGVDFRAEARRWTRWAERWTPPRIRRGIEAALAADRALKGTRITDERGAVADLVMTLALSSKSKREVA
ncbi:MAG TPA: DNA polymerase III subunit delta [Gemmatimonadales bacterium]|nr:DNA polymerase III subunit delta [Gemmatimonadales bacterium]